MINLLPPTEKRELRAARSNALLVRYNLFLLGALGFMLLAVGVVYFYLNSTKASAEQTIKENNAKVADYEGVRKQADEFRKNLETTKKILDQEIKYSDVTLALSALMPQGTVLDSLVLDSATFGTPITLNARAKSYPRALALKNSFEKSKLFSDVHFESIAGGADGNYPVVISLSVTVKKGAVE